MKVRMTKQRKKLFEKMSRDVHLITEHTDFGNSYTLSDGSGVSQTVAETLFNLGVFEPVGDGMFGASQSFKLRGDFVCGA